MACLRESVGSTEFTKWVEPFHRLTYCNTDWVQVNCPWVKHIVLVMPFDKAIFYLTQLKKSLDKILNNPTKDSFYECIVSINQWTIKICVNGPIRGIPLTSAFNFISYPESSKSVKTQDPHFRFFQVESSKRRVCFRAFSALTNRKVDYPTGMLEMTV